jgi:hypothetical protein
MALGQDLGGSLLIDLLLDNMPELRSVDEARGLLRIIGEPMGKEEKRGG